MSDWIKEAAEEIERFNREIPTKHYMCHGDPHSYKSEISAEQVEEILRKHVSSPWRSSITGASSLENGTRVRFAIASTRTIVDGEVIGSFMNGQVLQVRADGTVYELPLVHVLGSSEQKARCITFCASCGSYVLHLDLQLTDEEMKESRCPECGESVEFAWAVSCTPGDTETC